jgi:isoquinoline 1-oxidoreductase alpha subunit
VRSCQLPLSAIKDGSAVTTIEGLRGEELHPAQQTWIDHDVPQCGFCQPGQIMQAASIIDHSEADSREQFVSAMSNNLCRCGTHARIVKALADLIADPSNETDHES